MSIEHQKVTALFDKYLTGFIKQDLFAVMQCYQTPCTLTTPEELKYIEDENQLEQTLAAIFSQLSTAHVVDIKVPQASFELMDQNLALVAIHWQFIDKSQQAFAEFCAFYHVTLTSFGSAKIRHVISHEISELKCFHSTIQLGNN
ncbi:hypothetical protein [Thalassotalea sediminis]|uniref:hypothetical protein n=1 Tax=Thalassotalea sediminis TaxID=1759089 RepID=UPI002573CCC9|nr:hypothetical protein [Thalassotalea sediminis]